MAESVAIAAAAVNTNGIKTILVSGFSIFFIKSNPVLSNLKNLYKNPPDYPILCNWVFNDFTLIDEPFVKALQSFENYVLVNSNLCRKLFSSLESPITFDEIFKVT